jgi:pimeloyl-ACP methyl ester carboxylesterase
VFASPLLCCSLLAKLVDTPQAVLDAIHSRADIDKTKIVLFGRSLGGAVAVYLADKEPSRVSGFVLTP